MMNFRHPWLLGLAGLTLCTLVPDVGLAQESRSAPLAQQLVEQMERAQLQSIAAKDPADADRFVAALFFPGQLLVMSARYEVPVYLEEKLADKQYREVYIDLNSASIPESRVFITDSSANGLQALRTPDNPFDGYDGSGRQVRFDGDWETQQMSRDDYMKIFTTADNEYTRMLRALLTGIR